MSEKHEFVSALLEAKRANPRGYRIALGVIRAMYLESNPKPPSRRKADREFHASVKAKVHKVDFARAHAFRTKIEEANALRRAAHRGFTGSDLNTPDLFDVDAFAEQAVRS